VRHLPPGVMVGDNDTGSWFADLIQTGAEYIAPLLKAVPHPYAQGISTALTAGNSMVQAFRAKPKSERAAINQAAKAAINRVGNGGTARGPKKKKVTVTVKVKGKKQARQPRKNGRVKFSNVAKAPRRGQPQSTWIVAKGSNNGSRRNPRDLNVDEVD